MSTGLIEAAGLTVTYRSERGSFLAVDDVSVGADEGEAIGIVGESGSGKTTVGRVLVGLQAPDRGQVRLAGRTIVDGRAHTWRRADRLAIQMIFQDPYSSLNPRLRAWATVAEAIAVCQRVPAATARRAAFDSLLRLGITASQAELFPRSLSGGQRQRVSIARALAANPRVLVADEPTSSIDQSIQAQLLNVIRELQVERGLTVVFISHDLGVVSYLTSRTYVMRAGAVVEHGETRQILRAPREAYTRALVEAIPGRLGTGATS